jgi:hypothetical protein
MSTTFVTPQHILNAIHQFNAAIKPAVLDPEHAVENGTILVEWCKANGTAFNDLTADALRRAASAEATKLFWKVKPAKLASKDADRSGSDRQREDKAATVKAKAEAQQTQKAAEQNLADAKIYKECESVILAYYPTTKFGSLAEGRQRAERERLTDWVASVQGKFTADAILKAVLAEIEKLYATEEKSRERV